MFGGCKKRDKIVNGRTLYHRRLNTLDLDCQMKFSYAEIEIFSLFSLAWFNLKSIKVHFKSKQNNFSIGRARMPQDENQAVKLKKTVSSENSSTL